MVFNDFHIPIIVLDVRLLFSPKRVSFLIVLFSLIHKITESNLWVLYGGLAVCYRMTAPVHRNKLLHVISHYFVAIK